MHSSKALDQLRSAVPVIEPSLLACDFANLQQELRRLEEAGAKCLHLDVMDGHFVPNISFGIPIVEAVRRTTGLVLDVHLMIDNPAAFIEPFCRAGADMITFHIEVAENPAPLLAEIHRRGAGAGLSLNPTTPTEQLEPWLDQCDLVLVMSVMPGFGGQSFQPVALEKLKFLRDRRPPGMLLSVDGGVNGETIVGCAEAGADILVMGTAFFGHSDYRERLAHYSRLVRST